MSFIPQSEQETVIQFNHDSKELEIYTSDQAMIRKFDKNCEDASGDWKCVKEDTVMGGDEVVSKTYKVNRKAVLFLQHSYPKREMTPEEKSALAERLNRYRQNQKKK